MATQKQMLGERVGEAWRLHRYGDNSAALDIFADLTRDAPRTIGSNELDDMSGGESDTRVADWVNYIDALYGYGLALRKDGNEEKAVENLQQALDQTDMVLRALGVDSLESGSNSLDSFADDRFIMLRRMIEQRLEELGANPGS